MTATIGAGLDHAPTANQGVVSWVQEIAELATPDRVVWCDGSDAEWTRLTDQLVEQGTITRLDPDKKPNSFCAASDAGDVARVEERTFICTETERGAGPTNNWVAPAEMKQTMTELYRGSMRGRTLYVVPFCMGPTDAEDPMLGVEITDSEYVVIFDEDHDPDGLARAAAARLNVDVEEWKAEIPLIEEWFDKIGDNLPTSIRDEFEALKQRLNK
ncbi:hypothetical protein I4I78_05135 [Pseudonocardia sp. KRD-291]|nr:hypothetical protein [Pseudonocardia sp. KRD291]